MNKKQYAVFSFLSIFLFTTVVLAQEPSYDPVAEWNGPHFHVINGTGQYELNNVDDPVIDIPFENPFAVAVWNDGSDYISYVVDSFNDRVQFFATNISALSEALDYAAVPGAGEFGGDDIYFTNGGIVPGSEVITIDGVVYTRVNSLAGYSAGDEVYTITYSGVPLTGGYAVLPAGTGLTAANVVQVEYAYSSVPATAGTGDIDYLLASAAIGGATIGDPFGITEIIPNTASHPSSFENIVAIAINDNSLGGTVQDIYLLDAGDATEKLMTYQAANDATTFEWVSTYDGPLSNPLDVDFEESSVNVLESPVITDFTGAGNPPSLAAVDVTNNCLVTNHTYQIDVVTPTAAGSGDLVGGVISFTDNTTGKIIGYYTFAAGGPPYTITDIPGLSLSITCTGGNEDLIAADLASFTTTGGTSAAINDFIFICDSGNDRIKVIKGGDNGEPATNGTNSDFFAGTSRQDEYWLSDGTTPSQTFISASRAEEGTFTLYTGDYTAAQATWTEWTRVDNFFSSTPSSNHYTYDYDSQIITLGDGVFGAIPALGDYVITVYDESIDVLDYGMTGSGTGNFDMPSGIVARYNASHGWFDVYVADTDNNRIVKLKFYPGTLSNQGSATMQWVTSWNYGSSTSDLLDSPTDLAIIEDNQATGTDQKVYLFVCDTGNDRIVVYRDAEAEDNGGGGSDSPTFSNVIGGTGTSMGQFTNPRGVSVVANVDNIDVYVTDNTRGWVTKFEEGTTPTIDIDYSNLATSGYPPNASYNFEAVGSAFATNAPDGAYIIFYYSAQEDDPSPTLCSSTQVSPDDNTFGWTFSASPGGIPADGTYYLYAWLYNTSGIKIAEDNSASTETLIIDSELSQGLSIFDPLDDDRYLYLQNGAERTINFTIDYPDSIVAANFAGTFTPSLMEILSIEIGPAWQSLQQSQTIFVSSYNNTLGRFEINTSVLGSNTGLFQSGNHVVAAATIRAKTTAINTAIRVKNDSLVIATGGITDINGEQVSSIDLRSLYLRAAYLGDISGDTTGSAGSVPNLVPLPDGKIGFNDLVAFTMGWNGVNGQRDPISDLGPVSGTVPNLIALPDGKWNVYDLVAFTQMFNWYMGQGFASFAQDGMLGGQIPAVIDPDMSINNGEITLSLKANGITDLMSAHLTIKFAESELTLSEVEEGEFLAGNSQTFFEDIHNPGEVQIFQSRLDGSEPSVSGTGVLAELRFSTESDEIPVFNIRFDFRDKDGKVIESGSFNYNGQEIPKSFKLGQNYPNPFNPETAINFELPIAAKVTINVYNIKGERVAVVLNEWMGAGQHTIVWNGKDSRNEIVSSGIYFYEMQTEKFKSVKKMIMLK